MEAVYEFFTLGILDTRHAPHYIETCAEAVYLTKHRMDLHLTFTKGRINGTGSDNVRRFTIKGSFDEGTQECSWAKQYLGAHAVAYQGVAEKRGIWGTWQLDGQHGGFHIWPLQSSSGDFTTAAQRLTKPSRQANKRLKLTSA